MVGLTFTDFVDSLCSVNRNFKVLQFFCVDCFESHVQLVLGSLVRKGFKSAAAKVHWNLQLVIRKLAELDRGQVCVTVELVEAWVRVRLETAREAADLHAIGPEFSCVNFDLIFERIVTDTLSCIGDLLHDGSDLRRVGRKAEHKVAGNGGILIRRQVLIVEVRDLIDVCKLAKSSEEVVG